MSDELNEIRDMLAQVLEAQQPAPDPTATDPNAGSLIEAMHPGAVPRFSAEDNQRFAEHLTVSAEDMHGGTR